MNEYFDDNASNPNNEDSRENNATNTFNLIIGIATLLIALLGATFAYFSATARSAENDVTVKSAYVSISYDGGTEIKASNLIPSTLNVALKKYQKEKYTYDTETKQSLIVPHDPLKDGAIITDYDTYKNDVNRKCVDAKGKEVCYVYQFSIESDGAVGDKTDIIASIKINNNQFENLSYMLYEVDLREEEGIVVTDKYGFGIVDITRDEDDNILNDGYHYVTNNFVYVDKNNDNIDFADIKFDKFPRPFDLIGENGEFEGTVNPVVCLFGYENDRYIDEYNTDIANMSQIVSGDATAIVADTARCKPFSIENQVKHTYQLIIWLEETGFEQNEQGMTFEGTVSIEVSGGFESGEYGNGQISGQE